MLGEQSGEQTNRETDSQTRVKKVFFVCRRRRGRRCWRRQIFRTFAAESLIDVKTAEEEEAKNM